MTHVSHGTCVLFATDMKHEGISGRALFQINENTQNVVCRDFCNYPKFLSILSNKLHCVLGAHMQCLSQCNSNPSCSGFWVNDGSPIGPVATTTTTTTTVITTPSTTTTTTTTTTSTTTTTFSQGSCLGHSEHSSCCTRNAPCGFGQVIHHMSNAK